MKKEKRLNVQPDYQQLEKTNREKIDWQKHQNQINSRNDSDCQRPEYSNSLVYLLNSQCGWSTDTPF